MHWIETFQADLHFFYYALPMLFRADLETTLGLYSSLDEILPLISYLIVPISF